MTMTIAVSHWGWPQWVYAGILLLAIISCFSLHGKPRKNYNGWETAANCFFALFILVAGGFFA